MDVLVKSLLNEPINQFFTQIQQDEEQLIWDILSDKISLFLKK